MGIHFQYSLMLSHEYQCPITLLFGIASAHRSRDVRPVLIEVVTLGLRLRPMMWMWWDVMLWCDVMWCDVIRYGLTWHGMTWYGMVWYDIWHDMTCHDMIWYVIWCDMIWYDTIRYDIVLYVMLCYVMLCNFMLWHGMVWHHIIYHITWHDMTRHYCVWEFYELKLMSQVVISLTSRPTINHGSSLDYQLVWLGIECVKFKNLCMIDMAKAFYGI